MLIKNCLKIACVERTFAMIKPDAFDRREAIKQVITSNGFTIVSQKEITMEIAVAQNFYIEHKDRPFYGELTTFMSSGKIVILCLEKEQAISQWRKLLGPTNSHKAKEEDPFSIRSIFGTDGQKNACHGSDSPASAVRELKIFFPETIERTYAMIKPDAIDRKDKIIAVIKAHGFHIEKEKEMKMNTEIASLFYQEHKERSFFSELTTFMTSGNVICLLLERGEAIKGWRALMGPTNTAKAKETQPQSIRAVFGIDGQKNATHGSDSVESANRELKLIFDL